MTVTGRGAAADFSAEDCPPGASNRSAVSHSISTRPQARSRSSRPPSTTAETGPARPPPAPICPASRLASMPNRVRSSSSRTTSSAASCGQQARSSSTDLPDGPDIETAITMRTDRPAVRLRMLDQQSATRRRRSTSRSGNWRSARPEIETCGPPSLSRVHNHASIAVLLQPVARDQRCGSPSRIACGGKRACPAVSASR